MERLFLERELSVSSNFTEARNYIFGENFQIAHLSNLFRTITEIDIWTLSVRQRTQAVINRLDSRDKLVLLKDIEFVANELKYIRKRLGGN